MRGLLLRVGSAMCLAQFECVLEQFAFMGLGQQAHRVLGVAGFTAGVDKGAAAKVRRAEPALERAEQLQQALAAVVAVFHFAAQPLHPALVAALKGSNHQLILVGEVAVDTLSRHPGGFHQ